MYLNNVCSSKTFIAIVLGGILFSFIKCAPTMTERQKEGIKSVLYSNRSLLYPIRVAVLPFKDIRQESALQLLQPGFRGNIYLKERCARSKRRIRIQGTILRQTDDYLTVYVPEYILGSKEKKILLKDIDLELIAANQDKKREDQHYTDFCEINLSEKLTKIFVQTLINRNVFADVEQVIPDSNTDDLENNIDYLKSLKSKYDAVFVGKIKRYYGYVEGHEKTQIYLTPFVGPLFAWIIVYQLPSNIEADTYLTDLKLISTNDYMVLWKGEIGNKIIDRKIISGKYRYFYVKKSFEDTIAKLISEIKSAKIKFKPSTEDVSLIKNKRE